MSTGRASAVCIAGSVGQLFLLVPARAHSSAELPLLAQAKAEAAAPARALAKAAEAAAPARAPAQAAEAAAPKRTPEELEAACEAFDLDMRFGPSPLPRQECGW